MLALIGNELYKLRTTRTPWTLLSIQLGLVVVGVAGVALHGPATDDPLLVREMLAHAGILSLFALILGINAVAGEYRHKTITDTYLAVPRRDRIIAAKLVAYTGVGLLFGIASVAVALIATIAWFATKSLPLDLANEGLWRTMVGAILWNGLYAAVGVSLGALIPNLASAIGFALAWILIVEGLVGQLIGEYSRWLPLASGRALGNLPGDLLSQLAGGVVLAGYAVVLAIIAVATSIRRDVT